MQPEEDEAKDDENPDSVKKSPVMHSPRVKRVDSPKKEEPQNLESHHPPVKFPE
jgi:hypothetical protein